MAFCNVKLTSYRNGDLRMKFDELNIDERILRAVEDMGFEETSPIQTQAIPAVLE